MDQILNDYINRIDRLGIVPFPENLRGQVREGTIQECRVIFLGGGGGGKSSLIERIIHDTVGGPYRNPTTGIDTSWGLTTARRINNPGKAVCCLRFMDFGGQEIQANIHRCFMTEHTIYVLVCDLDKARSSSSPNAALDQISRWLYELHLYAPESPVLVVLNKSDLVGEMDIPRLPATQRRAGAINGAVHGVLITSAVKATRDEAVGELVEAIRREILGCLKAIEKQERWHKNWLAVRRELEEQDKFYIKQEEFRTICQRHWVLHFQEKKLLAWLQNQGVFYVCSCAETKNNRLSKTEESTVSDLPALLNPVWLAKRIYHVVSYVQTEHDSKSGTARQYLLRHEDVLRILHCLNELNQDEIVSVTPLELRQRMDAEYAVNATEKEQHEKEYLFSVTRRLSLSLLLGHNEEAFLSRMTEREVIPEDIRSELHQRWIICPISKSGETYAPPFHVSILHHMMCTKADYLKKENKNYAQFANGECRVVIVLDKSQLDLYFWGETRPEGKRFLTEFRDLVRDYLKKHHIFATEYAFDGNKDYAIDQLKDNARVVLNEEHHLTGRDIMREYNLPMGFPSSRRKKTKSKPVTGFQRATQFLALSTVVMVAMILLFSLGKSLLNAEVSSSEVSISELETVAEDTGSSASTVDQESTHTGTAGNSAEDAEHFANARWTDTKRVLLIFCVSVGTILVVTLFVVLLFLRVKRRDEEHNALMGTLTDIRNLIGSSQK